MKTIGPTYPARKVIFEGDSRMAGDSLLNGQNNAQFIPVTVYNSLISSYPDAKLCMFSYAEGGRKMSQILADKETVIGPIARPGDIIVLWEITNEMGPGGTSASDCFDMIQEYSDYVRGLGCVLVVCTEIARDKVGDDVNLWTDMQSCNSLILSAGSSIADAICDLGANSHFDSKADCADTTYYNSDKLHLATTGSTLCATLITASVSTLNI